MYSTTSLLSAGLAGTAAMTAFVYLVALIARRRYYVVHLLAEFLKTSLLWAAVAHLAIGYLFVGAYALLFRFVTGDPGPLLTLLLGVVSGVLAIIAWRSLFALSAHPPRVDLRGYLGTIFLAHLVFAGVAVPVVQWPG